MLCISKSINLQYLKITPNFMTMNNTILFDLSLSSKTNRQTRMVLMFPNSG